MPRNLSITETTINGLLVVSLPLHGDKRGWFKEHWQREKMVAQGLPDFIPVQQNVSFNADVGTTRGIHAEPWDKYVSVVNGRAFGAWVDLREGPDFGTVFTAELSPETAVFVPRGVANAFQTLTRNTSYMYLVNDHWSADAEYAFVNLGDPTLAIDWPISLTEAVVSEKDSKHPVLSEVNPLPQKATVVIGATGQLGCALKKVLPSENTCFISRDQIDLNSIESIEQYDWNNVGVIINAAAFTEVDRAELPEGRKAAWQINSTAVATLAKIAKKHRATFVTVSTDYVFDGVQEEHTEHEYLSPKSVYGQSKAAGELAAMISPNYYIVRTSWVIGEGPNFVRTMQKLAESGVNPLVVDDQFGRLTFASELAEGIVHLISTQAPFGIYNISSSGPVKSWYDIAVDVFNFLGHDPNRVSAVSSENYVSQQKESGKVIAPRPQNSVFDLTKIRSTGFDPSDGSRMLKAYLTQESRADSLELNFP